jgi:hypothetical protein
VRRREEANADEQEPPVVRLNRRLREAFVAGAEECSRRRFGRGLTQEELERVLRRYPATCDVRRQHDLLMVSTTTWRWAGRPLL